MDKHTAEFISRVAQSLPADLDGTTMQRWIDNPQGLQNFLRGLCLPASKVWNIWKTIKLGTGLKTADDFRHALKDNGDRIGEWGNDILGQSAFTTETEETEVNLVIVSVAELGFKNGATRANIYNRARKLGLGLCPAEVGPQLRLQYKDQPNGEWPIIGIEPISDSGGYLRVFGVGHDGDSRWLVARDGLPDHFWGGGHRFVFLSRK